MTEIEKKPPTLAGECNGDDGRASDPLEQCVGVEYIAERTIWSKHQVQKMFKDEPGVRSLGKARNTALSIPLSVMRRVLARYENPKRETA